MSCFYFLCFEKKSNDTCVFYLFFYVRLLTFLILSTSISLCLKRIIWVFYIRKIFAYLYSALHAHTLLLDLEQLVVVANLDKLNLNSSSSACSTTNSALNYSSTSKSVATTTTTTTTSTLSTSTHQNISAMTELKLVNNNINHNNNKTHRTTTYQHDIDNLVAMDNVKFNQTNFTKCTNGLNQLRFDTNHKSMVTGIPHQMNKSFDLYFSKLIICLFISFLAGFTKN